MNNGPVIVKLNFDEVSNSQKASLQLKVLWKIIISESIKTIL